MKLSFAVAPRLLRVATCYATGALDARSGRRYVTYESSPKPDHLS
jgi:hypothetical protein